MPGLISTVRLLVRDAVRAVRSDLRTSLLAISVLSIAMAAGVTTFSVVAAVAIRPLPYRSPDRLVGVMIPPSPPAGASSSGRVITPMGALPAPQHYFLWLERTRAFQALGASRSGPVMVLTTGNTVAGLRSRRISANLFDVLGVRPLIGHFFAPDNERPGGPRAVILT